MYVYIYMLMNNRIYLNLVLTFLWYNDQHKHLRHHPQTSVILLRLCLYGQVNQTRTRVGHMAGLVAFIY